MRWVEQVPTLEQALGTLSEEARAVVWLHDVEGYTHKEIGELMGKTTSFSKSQLARAYERLLQWQQHIEAAQSTADKRVDGQHVEQHSQDKTHGQNTVTDIGPACPS
jgi:hypothetical protein